MGRRAPRLAGDRHRRSRPPIATTTSTSTATSPAAAAPPPPPTAAHPHLVQNVNVFKFGSDSIGICEAGGRRIVERVFDAQQKAYAATAKIQSAARRRSSAAAAAADVAAAAGGGGGGGGRRGRRRRAAHARRGDGGDRPHYDGIAET